MQIILCEDIRRLGNTGDVVKVKDGFARNFLLPQKKAFLATPSNLQKIEREKLKRSAQEVELKAAAQDLAQKLKGASINIAVEVNDLEKLYGSVTEIDVIRALEIEGFKIDKKMLHLEKPIEELGIYEIPVELHRDVITKIRVWVTKK